MFKRCRSEEMSKAMLINENKSSEVPSQPSKEMIPQFLQYPDNIAAMNITDACFNNDVEKYQLNLMDFDSCIVAKSLPLDMENSDFEKRTMKEEVIS